MTDALPSPSAPFAMRSHFEKLATLPAVIGGDDGGSKSGGGNAGGKDPDETVGSDVAAGRGVASAMAAAGFDGSEAGTATCCGTAAGREVVLPTGENTQSGSTTSCPASRANIPPATSRSASTRVPAATLTTPNCVFTCADVLTTSSVLRSRWNSGDPGAVVPAPGAPEASGGGCNGGGGGRSRPDVAPLGVQ